jgi:cytochrome c551/c552
MIFVIYDQDHISRLYVRVILYRKHFKTAMDMKNMILVLGMAVGMVACSDNASGKKETNDAQAAADKGAPSYDPKRGAGKFTKVDISPTLDAAMAESGQKVADMKCISCHKLTDEKLVGPGWKGVTSRRTPEWIMNFITNTDEMLQKDAEAQAMLELCLVRMPNQNLTDDEARHVYEFMRKNDGVK